VKDRTMRSLPPRDTGAPGHQTAGHWTPGAAAPGRPPLEHERPPGWALFATDAGRALASAGLSAAGRTILRAAPRGDGHPVLVLPGLGAGDASTLVLRRVLRRLGHRVYGWRLGVNRGPTNRVVDEVPALVADLHARHDRRVSVIGWSLGGIYAHSAARAHPDLVRQVVTLGSPIRLSHPAQTRAMAYYRRHSHRHVPEHRLPPSELSQPPLPVPATSILSTWDGIVSWRACLHEPGEHHENIAVVSSHFGIGNHPAALWAVADRLAQPEDTWRPFQPPTVLAPLFPPVGPPAGEAPAG
jgi:pimeloyl-ACP methyl ester carboxylesterase